MTVWYADRDVAALRTARDLSSEDLAAAVADAGTVYERVAAEAGIGESDLRAWGEGVGIGPDRMNAALGLLRDARRAFPLPSRLPSAAPAEAADGPSATVLVEGFTAAELRKAADRLGVEVPKSATKDEVAAALLAGPEPE